MNFFKLLVRPMFYSFNLFEDLPQLGYFLVELIFKFGHALNKVLDGLSHLFTGCFLIREKLFFGSILNFGYSLQLILYRRKVHLKLFQFE